MPIIGIAPKISNELGQSLARLHISKVLPASKNRQGLTQTIHEALASLDPATWGKAKMVKLANPEPALLRADRRPTSTVAPMSTPPDRQVSPPVVPSTEAEREDPRLGVAAEREPVLGEEPE
jgi:hypothetical protein